MLAATFDCHVVTIRCNSLHLHSSPLPSPTSICKPILLKEGKEKQSGYSVEERERLGLATNVEWAGGKVKGLSIHIERVYADLDLRPVQEQVRPSKA